MIENSIIQGFPINLSNPRIHHVASKKTDHFFVRNRGRRNVLVVHAGYCGSHTSQPDRNIFAGLNGFLRKVRENTRAAAGRRCDKSYLPDSLHAAVSRGCTRVHADAPAKGRANGVTRDDFSKTITRQRGKKKKRGIFGSRQSTMSDNVIRCTHDHT